MSIWTIQIRNHVLEVCKTESLSMKWTNQKQYIVVLGVCKTESLLMVK